MSSPWYLSWWDYGRPDPGRDAESLRQALDTAGAINQMKKDGHARTAGRTATLKPRACARGTAEALK